jgi:ferredoxin--NADP+ reductase
VKFTKKEMEYVIANLDIAALDAELARCNPNMHEVGQDAQAARDYILSALPKALPSISDTRFYFDFLASPSRIVGDENGRAIGLEVEDTKLVPMGENDTKAVRLGTHRMLNVDSVIFCIGDKVDERFGLPIQWNEFVKHPEPCYPVDGVSYEAYDPNSGRAVEGVFVAGWSREASSGLVGVARKDGENGARAVLRYLSALPGVSNPEAVFSRLEARLAESGKRIVTREDVLRLEAAEQAEAARQGLNEYKFRSNEEMLSVIT